MSIFSRIKAFGTRMRGWAARSAYPPEWLVRYLGGEPTASAMHVGANEAIRYSPFFAAVDLISRDVAKLPAFVYRKRLDDSRTRLSSYPAYTVLHVRPNLEQTPFAFKQMMQAYILTWGNAYAEIERGSSSAVTALRPLRPNRVQPVRMDRTDELYYEVYNDRGQLEKRLNPYDMLHIHGIGDGIVGYSPVSLFREAIGLGLAAERYGAAFFGNDARPGGVLKHPGKLSEAAIKNIRQQWEELHSGPDRARKMAVLPEGMGWESVGIPPEDAQFLETRAFQVKDIARIFHLPAHKLGDLDRATWANIEQQAIEYVQDCLSPWLVCWEQEINHKLILPNDIGKVYAEFQLTALLRGDTESRYRAYGQAIQSGWMNRNEVRRLENLDPFEGGDEYLVPVNMAPASQLGKEPPTPKAPNPTPITGDDGRSRIRAAHMPLLLDCCSRILHKEHNAISKAQNYPPDRRDRSVEEFLAQHGAHVRRVLEPAALAYVGALDRSVSDVPERVHVFALRHVERLRRDPLQAIAGRGSATAAAMADALMDQLGENHAIANTT